MKVRRHLICLCHRQQARLIVKLADKTDRRGQPICTKAIQQCQRRMACQIRHPYVVPFGGMPYRGQSLPSVSPSLRSTAAATVAPGYTPRRAPSAPREIGWPNTSPPGESTDHRGCCASTRQRQWPPPHRAIICKAFSGKSGNSIGTNSAPKAANAANVCLVHGSAGVSASNSFAK